MARTNRSIIQEAKDQSDAGWDYLQKGNIEEAKECYSNVDDLLNQLRDNQKEILGILNQLHSKNG